MSPSSHFSLKTKNNFKQGIINKTDQGNSYQNTIITRRDHFFAFAHIFSHTRQDRKCFLYAIVSIRHSVLFKLLITKRSIIINLHIHKFSNGKNQSQT